MSLTRMPYPPIKHFHHATPDHFIQQANNETIKRLLNAALQEQLISYEQQAEQIIISLPQIHSVLKITRNPTQHSLAPNHNIQEVMLHKQNIKHPQPVTTVQFLLELLQPLMPSEFQPQWPQLIEEINNHVSNTALSLWNNFEFDQLIITAAKQQNSQTLCQWLAQHVPPSTQNVFFEQWASGHPYHPCAKTKLHMSHNEILQYAPEFHSLVNIPIAALAQDSVHIEAQDQQLDYKAWFAHQFQAAYSLWQAWLSAAGVAVDNFIPIPIHPWQLQYSIPIHFANLLEEHKLLVNPDVYITTQPSLSMRTMIPISEKSPHIKLPVATQTTSALRTVSPASTENGPKISSLLLQILKQEQHFGERLSIMPEYFGLHVMHCDDQVAKHLSALFRANSQQDLQPGEIAIVVAALFKQSPISQKPLLIELTEVAGVTSKSAALYYFAHYADIVLGAYLDLYLKYGIALEAHQQNTLIVFSAGQVIRVIARDFGGLRLHLPSLAQHDLDFTPYPGSATIIDDRAECCRKLLHTVYQYHLSECIFYLSQYYQLDADYCWRIVKQITEQHFAELRSVVDASYWQQDYQAILQAPWPFKALLRMRLNNISHDYIYLPTANPLAT